MEIQIEKRDKVTIAHLSKRIDSSFAKDFETQALNVLDEGAQNLILDFSSLDYISSAGLRVILMLAKRLKSGGGKLALASLSPAILEVFTVSGFANMLPVYKSLDLALQEI